MLLPGAFREPPESCHSVDAVLAWIAAGGLNGTAGLAIRNRDWDDAAVARLVGAPALDGLRGLGLHGVEFGDPGAAALAASPHLAGLRALGISFSSGITNTGVKAIAASPFLGNLRFLALEENRMKQRLRELLKPVKRCLTDVQMGVVQKVGGSNPPRRSWSPYAAQAGPVATQTAPEARERTLV